MTEPAIAIDRPITKGEHTGECAAELGATVALSADGHHVAVIRNGALAVDGMRVEFAGEAIAAAALEREVWCVARDASGHRLERFGFDRARIGAATPLGSLGDRVSLAAA